MCILDFLDTRGKTAVQDLSAALADAVGSVREMPKHFCELQLDELGLRCFINYISIWTFASKLVSNYSLRIRYLDRVEALNALTNAVLWHPGR